MIAYVLPDVNPDICCSKSARKSSLFTPVRQERKRQSLRLPGRTHGKHKLIRQNLNFEEKNDGEYEKTEKEDLL